MVPVLTHKVPSSTQIEGIGTTSFGEGAINIVQLIMDMTNSEKRSPSVPLETNGQDETTPEHVTVASASLSALLKAKNLFWNSKIIHRRNFYWYRHI